MSIGFPAKLLIEGRVVEDKFPDWFAVLRGSRHGQNFDNIMPKPNESNQRSNTAPAPNSQQIPTGPDIMRDQQQGQSDTDEEKRDTALQMDTDINDSEASVHSNELSQSEHRSPAQVRGSYDNAMASLERLFQLQTQVENPAAPMNEAPPVRDKTLAGCSGSENAAHPANPGLK